MRLPLAIATLALAVTTALPAFAATPTAPLLASLQNAAATPVEAVQHRRATRQRQTRTRAYRNGYNAYAAAPYSRRVSSWGHCVSGLDRGARSAFPAWDLC
ncbi:MAG: hypothetical protein GEU95_05020 [Rhizobiales bacterium]|nr:hypothetical protein [Hyphomicrobiales bacterium]